MHLLKPLAAAALAFSAFTASAVTTYDAAADFSTASNPNGVWSYGFTSSGLGGAFFALNDTTPLIAGFQDWTLSGGLPAVYKNATASPITAGTATYAPGSLGFHPGDNNLTAVVRFTAPTAGLYDYNATFFRQDTQATSQIGFYNNGAQVGSLFSSSNFPVTKSGTAVFLAAGATLDAEVGNGGNGKNFDSTGLTFTVTAVPEPETAALMLAGLAAVGFVAKRRKS